MSLFDTPTNPTNVVTTASNLTTPSATPIVVGLDPSLTATGIATLAGVRTLRPKTKGTQRLIAIRDEITDICLAADLVAIEGVSFGSHSSHAHEIGGLAWIIRVALTEAGIAWVDVPPACLKKYATGKGNAGKEEVLAAAIRRLGYDGHDNNQADALWLRAMACDHLGHPAVDLPAVHRQGMTKVPWPETEAAA